MIARMLKLHHNTVKKLLKLKAKAEREGKYRVAKRIHAVLLNHHRHTSGNISQLLSSSKSRGSEWLKNYEELLLATEEILKDVHGYLKKNKENIERTRQYFSGDLKGESYKNVSKVINEMLCK